MDTPFNLHNLKKIFRLKIKINMHDIALMLVMFGKFLKAVILYFK